MANRNKDIKQAKSKHQQLQLPNQQIQNYLRYLQFSISPPRTFWFCDCIHSHVKVKHAFKRAFQKLAIIEKQSIYIRSVDFTHQILEDQIKIIPSSQLNHSNSFLIWNDNLKSFELINIIIQSAHNKIIVENGKQVWDLHFYLMRLSKNEKKEEIILESTEGLQARETIRIKCQINFTFYKDLIQKLVDRCLYNNLHKMIHPKYGKLKHIKQSISKQITESENKIKNQHQISIDYHPQLTENKQVHYFGNADLNLSLKNNKKIKEQNEENQVIVNLKEVRKNIFYNISKCQVIKKYDFGHKISVKWVCENITNIHMLKKWKPTLKTCLIIENCSEGSIYKQKHGYRQNIVKEYIYKRQKAVTDKFILIKDTSFGVKQKCQTFIQSCVWKITFPPINVEVACVIKHGEILKERDCILIDDFLGDLNLIGKQQKTEQLNTSQININTALFQSQFLSEINEPSFNSTLFYSIDQKSQRDINFKFQQDILVEKIISNKIDSSKSGEVISNYLKFNHPLKPFQKQISRLKLPAQTGMHPFWQNQWRLNEKGELVSINVQKLKAQNSVLKNVFKMIGSNLISGKSILNISLPVTIFSIESTISLLCKSYAYAPLLLEKASKCDNCIDRLKYVVAFALSCTIAEIQMEKPFNPILGQTFQTFIDGCPVYAEQISHHPPISSIMMKGRGYTFYGSFQSKVNIGFNSAKGINEGVMTISFDQQNLTQKLIKFTTLTGQMSGLTFGERKLVLLGPIYFFDVDNQLYIQLNIGKHKGISEYCKFADGVEGIITKVEGIDQSKFWNNSKIKKLHEYGMISGRWSSEILFQDQLIFDSWKHWGHQVQKYFSPLPSDSYYRKDLQFRVQNDFKNAQDTKQQLQEIQRNDKKMRKKK